MSADIHVVPIDDLREHDDVGHGCWCAPRIEYNGEDIVVVHHSMDGRELVEEHGIQ